MCSSGMHAGYGLIEVPLLDPATVDTAMTRAVLEEHGMAATTSLVRARLTPAALCPLGLGTE